MTNTIPSAPKVTVIPVREKQAKSRGINASVPSPKLLVAAYCRVSTDHEEQESSYEAQCAHYESFIRNNPDWELAGIYADEGISGLAANKRPEFKHLIADCMSGKVQMVITKSISRFARNTLDCLNYIRKLKEKGIPILFEKENILTTDAKGEILITIMASIAQQESASISQNVQMGVRYHYQQGKAGAGHQRFLGYSRTEEASLRIIPEEATVVRRIFREYLEGFSPKQIANGLTADHITWRYKQDGVWSQASLKYVLTNEKYMGNLLLQKYYTVDYLTKKVVRNHGEVPQYLVENSHPPIIPQEIFQLAQGEMSRRAKLYGKISSDNGNHANVASLKLFLSRRTVCGICGKMYCRKKEREHNIWRCGTNILTKFKDAHCDGRSIDEEAIHTAIVEAFNRLPEEEMNLVRLDERLKSGYLQRIEDYLEDNAKKLENLVEGDDDSELKAERADLICKRADAACRRIQVYSLLEKLKSVRGDKVEAVKEKPTCSNYDDFLKWSNGDRRVGKVTEYTDYEAYRYIEKIVIHPDRIEVVFKAGVSIDVEK